MSSALLAALFAILGTGLAVTSTACFVLWRRVRALTSPTSAEPVDRREIVVKLPNLDPAKPSSKTRSTVGRRLHELASRQKILEARLGKVEASASEPGVSKANRRVDNGQPATFEGPTLISVPNLASPPSTSSEAAAELDRRFGPIWGMADEGTSTESIARETGYPIGQVELILGLRRRLLVAENGTDG